MLIICMDNRSIYIRKLFKILRYKNRVMMKSLDQIDITDKKALFNKLNQHMGNGNLTAAKIVTLNNENQENILHISKKRYPLFDL